MGLGDGRAHRQYVDSGYESVDFELGRAQALEGLDDGVQLDRGLAVRAPA